MSVYLQKINKDAINASHASERDLVISNNSIQRVRKIQTFYDDKLNLAIQNACKKLLHTQMVRTDYVDYLGFDIGESDCSRQYMRYGEVLIIVSTVHPYSTYVTCYGDMRHVKHSDKYIEMMQLCHRNQLVQIHNHPYGGGLQWADIGSLMINDAIIQSVVVTNHGRVFQLTKTEWFDKTRALKVYNNISNRYRIDQRITMYSPEFYAVQRSRVRYLEQMLYNLGLRYITA